jgi:hypothetical protein
MWSSRLSSELAQEAQSNMRRNASRLNAQEKLKRGLDADAVALAVRAAANGAIALLQGGASTPTDQIYRLPVV